MVNLSPKFGCGKHRWCICSSCVNFRESVTNNKCNIQSDDKKCKIAREDEGHPSSSSKDFSCLFSWSVYLLFVTLYQFSGFQSICNYHGKASSKRLRRQF